MGAPSKRGEAFTKGMGEPPETSSPPRKRGSIFGPERNGFPLARE